MPRKYILVDKASGEIVDHRDFAYAIDALREWRDRLDDNVAYIRVGDVDDQKAFFDKYKTDVKYTPGGR